MEVQLPAGRNNGLLTLEMTIASSFLQKTV